MSESFIKKIIKNFKVHIKKTNRNLVKFIEALFFFNFNNNRIFQQGKEELSIDCLLVRKENCTKTRLCLCQVLYTYS
jgi:hypothetical protein